MGRADFLQLGDWNTVCFQCGFKAKASTLVRNWQGYYVHPEHNEPRQTQDFVRGVPDNQTAPWVQPAPAAIYTYTNIQLGQGDGVNKSFQLGCGLYNVTVTGAQVSNNYTFTASALVFGTWDGVVSTAQLISPSGDAITSASVTAMHRTDWQGRQLLYPTARTNYCYPSEPTVATLASSGGTPTITNGTISTSSASFTPNGIVFPPSPTVQQFAYIHTSIDYTTVEANQPLYFGILVSSTSSVAPLLSLNMRVIAYQQQLAIDSITVTTAGTNCWYYTGVGHSTNAPSPANYFGVARPIADPTPAETYTVSALMFSTNAMDIGVYIPTTAPVTVTDYTYTSAGAVTLGQVPAATALLDWDGTGTVDSVTSPSYTTNGTGLITFTTAPIAYAIVTASGTETMA